MAAANRLGEREEIDLDLLNDADTMLATVLGKIVSGRDDYRVETGRSPS
jgi:hypothetical protein